MKRYLYLILLLSFQIGGCARHSSIDFSSSNAFFSSLNKKEIIKLHNKSNIAEKSSLRKNDIKKIKNIKKNFKKSFLLNLSSYEKKLKEKFNFDEFKILKIFSKPDLEVKHGKIKNYQFHLRFCHLDLFFLKKDEIYLFKHHDIRPSSMSSNLNKKKCFKELNNKFTLLHDPK